LAQKQKYLVLHTSPFSSEASDVIPYSWLDFERKALTEGDKEVKRPFSRYNKKMQD